MSGTPPPDPLAPIRRGMDRLLGQVAGNLGTAWTAGGGPANPFATPGPLSPRLDLAETQDGIELTAELPGIDPKDVTIELEGGSLNLRAERHAERREAGTTWHIAERQTGTWHRRIPLPFDARPEAISARFDKGVLHVTIPREARQAPTRIEIKDA